jgi:hypothetical protein
VCGLRLSNAHGHDPFRYISLSIFPIFVAIQLKTQNRNASGFVAFGRKKKKNKGRENVFSCPIQMSKEKEREVMFQ